MAIYVDRIILHINFYTEVKMVGKRVLFALLSSAAAYDQVVTQDVIRNGKRYESNG